MIGQNLLKTRIKNELAEDKFARFVIIVGPKGSGKKTLVREMFPDVVKLEDVKVGSIRHMIEFAHVMRGKVFLIADADTMSGAGKSALLKIVEEGKDNHHYIMTVQDLANVSPTLRSRARIMRMSVYTPSEINQYIDETYVDFSPENRKIVLQFAETPGEVNSLVESNPEYFYEFVQLVFEKITKVSGANAFKIADRLSTKDGDHKWDIQMFLKMFSQLCIDKVNIKAEDNLDDIIRYSKGCLVCSKYKNQLRLSGINKAFLLDSWILEMRRIWM